MKKFISKVLVFASLVMSASAVFAQDAAQAVAQSASADRGLVALSAGLCIALAAFGGALAQGKTASTALEGIARNPAASGKILIPMILGLALIESLVIYALIIALGLK
jgi:F-type H+-transporting ATPase subunit c